MFQSIQYHTEEVKIENWFWICFICFCLGFLEGLLWFDFFTDKKSLMSFLNSMKAIPAFHVTVSLEFEHNFI